MKKKARCLRWKKPSFSSSHGDRVAGWGGKPVWARLSVDLELQPAYLLANTGSVCTSVYFCRESCSGDMVLSTKYILGKEKESLSVRWGGDEITSDRLCVQADDSPSHSNKLIWQSAVLLNWGCRSFLPLAEAAVLDEGFNSFADLFITSMVLKNISFPSSPTFLQSSGWAIVLRREHHLPACLWPVWTASVGQAAETGF